ncbi:MAG: lysophospholipid acyltransferase family protein [Pyrinomonadaceae bacterium]
MPSELDNVYRHAPIDRFRLKDRLLIRMADLGFYTLIRAIGSTLRYEVEGWDNYEQIAADGRVPIYCFWHDRIFAGTYFFRNRKIVVITSQSLDGEYIARFIQRLGYGVVRGSSSRGGVGALVEMIRLMRAGAPMAFTVDGPRGPRYAAKKGPVLLAKKTSNPMMPFVVECKRYWTVRSWDRLQIPRPFSRVKVIIAPPIYVDGNASEPEIDAKLAELQSSLDSLVERGKKWREI